MSYCALYGDRVWRSMPCSYTLIKLRQARIFMEHSTPTSIPFDKIRLKCLPEPPGSQASISPPNAPRRSPGMQPRSTARKYSGSFLFFGILRKSPDLKTFFHISRILYLPQLRRKSFVSEAGFCSSLRARSQWELRDPWESSVELELESNRARYMS